MISKSRIEKFIADVIRGGTFEGTKYFQVYNEWCLVVESPEVFFEENQGRMNLNNEIKLKIARNVDDLQYDYDSDWNMPIYRDSEGNELVFDTEMILDSSSNIKKVTEDILENLNYIVKNKMR